MPLLELDDVTLHYDDRQGGDGPSLLLLHGFAVSARVWEPMLAHLPAAHRVVRFDLRNHGRSGSAASSTISDNVDDVIRVIERLGLDRPVLVGSSVAAVFATEIAAHHPDAIGAAVLVGGIGHSFVTVPGMAEGNRAMAEGLVRDRSATAESVIPSWFASPITDETMRWMAAQVDELRPSATAIVDELVGWDPRPLLPRIDLPMHYVHGGLDAIPVQVARDCADLSPHGTLTVAEGVGHMPHLEAPEWTARVLDAVRTAD